jgi:Neprosin
VKLAVLLVYFLISLLFSGCTVNLDLSGKPGGREPPAASVLPDATGPDGQETAPSGEETVLDEAMRARKEESERYVKEVIYQGGDIVATRQLPSGDVVDFVARDSLPTLPYALPPLPWTPEEPALPPGVELAVSELEQIPELLALAATATPFHRPTFWPYILGESDATSIEDYLARYQVGGQPSVPERLYAGLRAVVPNRGGAAFVNQFRPAVEPGAFSLIELAVGCPAEGPTQDGDWWLAYQHELLGYFPAGRFTLLNSGACVVAQYGEIARMKPASGKRPPKAEMGSGRFAEAGAGQAASVRRPRYFDLLWFTRVPSDGRMTPSEPSCYTRTPLRNDIFFLGGHGDEDRGCTWPSP